MSRLGLSNIKSTSHMRPPDREKLPINTKYTHFLELRQNKNVLLEIGSILLDHPRIFQKPRLRI